MWCMSRKKLCAILRFVNRDAIRQENEWKAKTSNMQFLIRTISVNLSIPGQLN